MTANKMRLARVRLAEAVGTEKRPVNKNLSNVNVPSLHIPDGYYLPTRLNHKYRVPLQSPREVHLTFCGWQRRRFVLQMCMEHHRHHY